MNYDKEILRILYEAGPSGLSVQKIALHVHNACNTLFAPVDYDTTRREVLAWLARCARRADSAICKAGRRGYYCVNKNSVEVRQLLLEFDVSNDGPEHVGEKSQNDSDAPSLFGQK